MLTNEMAKIEGELASVQRLLRCLELLTRPSQG